MSALLRFSLLLVLVWPGLAAAKGILIVGDSISAGYGLDSGDGWVSLLQQRLEQRDLDIPVINASISGETTSGGRTRLPALLQRHRPQLLVIELGGNDGLRGTPLQVVEKNLDAMVARAKAGGVKVLLLGMRLPPNYGQRYTQGFHSLFSRVAERHQISYHPFFLQGIGTDRGLMQNDGIHPNRQAQPRLLDNIWPKLESLLTRSG